MLAATPFSVWASRILGDPLIACFAAESTGSTRGFFRLDTGPDQQAEVTLIVAPDQRRSGIGRRLLDEALRQARVRGLRKVRAVVDARNAAALGFFGEAGFAENGSNTPGNIHLYRLIHCAERQPPLEI